MAFAIKNRPFATEPITGMMLPDGVFAAGIGKENINAHFENTGADETDVQIYLESVSNPNIVVTPATFYVGTAEQSASHLFAWEADFSTAPAGKHFVSFIVQTSGGHQRIIQKIFVAKLGYDPGTQAFTAQVPEGVLSVQFLSMVGPGKPCGRCRPCDDCKCACDGPNGAPGAATGRANSQAQAAPENVLQYLTDELSSRNPNFNFCLPGYLIDSVHASVNPTPPFAGQYGDLPFQDPWWKLILCLIALLLLIAAAIAEAVGGSGSITVNGGSDGSDGSTPNCCGVSASGGGSSTVAAALVAAAATVATIAGATDVRDPFRMGQDHTAPASTSEKTIQEDLDMTFKYSDPVQPGKPFKVGIDWKYVRTTDVAVYKYQDSGLNANIHTLSKYVINAPDVVRAYKREPFIVKAQFYDATNKLFKGNQLFVQCYLIGPAGQFRRFILEDNGQFPDDKANDGTYTGRYQFTIEDKGIWTYFVLAQDVNTANPNLDPEQAAQIIGGMLLTGQITIGFEGGTCPLVPDGHVNVIA